MSTSAQSPQEIEPIDAVQAVLSEAGLHAGRLREVLRLLASGPHPLQDLVRRTGVPRRTVQDLLAACGGDVRSSPDGFALEPAAEPRYRERFEPAAGTGADETRALELLGSFVATGPRPSTALDHVSATPDTVLRRAVWLRDTFDLRGARVLCLGDHDLTSTAVALLAPEAEVLVLDLDERVLAHIDAVSAEHGLGIGTLHADLRFGIPPEVDGWADLVFTDPPYTPEGAGLFAARGAGCLSGPGSRLLVAYGFSPRTPALGQKVQQELLRMGLVFTAILPDFHSYLGAQAIGSTSDLYVCQPTAQTRKLALRSAAGIYTHGPQSVEAAGTEDSADFRSGIVGLVGEPVEQLRDPGWSRPIGSRPDSTPVFDLRADPGPWLLRMLLACHCPRVAFAVDNNHPDVADEAGQRGLSELVGPKFALRFHRSTPDSRHAVVLAEEVTAPSAVRDVLQRAHGKLGNVWREALIAHTAEGLTKRAARDRVQQAAQHPADLQRRLIDLPRHRMPAALRFP
ncbi:bis-aminopropyl spermidine synthase family protein [Saccharopolyspora sp. HNM0983]|uniref:Bis-aminopropyl spermidine synthase family protein n=1 Tax=Saccharopolyspora montiporae TaxID=2781240 RepID=A0A929BBQ1_9PSEU|nr:bis-aminopropyl spermidine synthase family protein [Saccharopolyspora sp. HNM0983]MBE9375825.1 bis-aminopropyl spermidine synthase family protein [Saccharopolyspora sp. HNM0983]